MTQNSCAVGIRNAILRNYLNHSKWPNKLNEARTDPAKKEELVRHCSLNTDDALLLCKEVNTCMTCVYDVIGEKLYYFLLCKV